MILTYTTKHNTKTIQLKYFPEIRPLKFLKVSKTLGIPAEATCIDTYINEPTLTCRAEPNSSSSIQFRSSIIQQKQEGNNDFFFFQRSSIVTILFVSVADVLIFLLSYGSFSLGERFSHSISVCSDPNEIPMQGNPPLINI